MTWRIVFLIISTLFGIYIGFLLQKPVSTICETNRCPYCYGDNLCKDVEQRRIHLVYRSFSDLFYNLVSVKNVYFGEYEGVRVVLKKLSHQKELDEITTPESIDEDDIWRLLQRDSLTNLKLCNEATSKLFFETIKRSFSLEQLWTILSINPEPLILTSFKDSLLPLPRLYGACGLVVVEKDCGTSLNHFENSPFSERAFLALQLLEAALKLTHSHETFRVYLTDISPDNIAVDADFNLYFIDLENVILKQKQDDEVDVHYSEFFDEEEFVYDEKAICGGSLSDHNIYAVCKLLLSRRAPWPMMQNGLLHSPPNDVAFRYDELGALIEECVESKEKFSRFYIAEELIKLLNELIGSIRTPLPVR